MSGEYPDEREQRGNQQVNRQSRAPQGGQQQSGSPQQRTQPGGQHSGGRHGQHDQPQGSQRRPRQQSGGTASATSILSEKSGKTFLLYIIGVFGAVALGYGVGLLLLDALADGGTAFLVALALFIPVLGAPIIAMATGLLTGLRLNASDTQAAVVSGVGAFAGFIAMLLVFLVFAALIFEGGDSSTVDGGTSGSSDGSLSDSLGPLIGFSTGVAVAGAATTYVVKRIEI
jgi:hypothetical protein